jgi:cytochrome c2
MPSRPLDLLKPRSLALLLAGLGGGYIGARLRPAGKAPPEEGPPEPYWFPAPLLGLAILAFCAALTGASLAWTAYRESAKARSVAIALTGGNPDRAPALAARYGCVGCHTIPGIPGADGKVAAPLAGMRARVFVGGVLPNTAQNLVAWIVDPPAFSPRTAMPVTGITEGEARDVAAYLYAR